MTGQVAAPKATIRIPASVEFRLIRKQIEATSTMPHLTVVSILNRTARLHAQM
jgi:hypothetical protein